MSDEFFSMLDQFLNHESMMPYEHAIIFKMDYIFSLIHPKILKGLVDAEKEGNAARVDELLLIEEVLTKNMKNNKDTLLHFAAKYGTVKTVLRLLKFGANVNAKNSDLKTPIFYAIRNSLEMVNVLLSSSNVYDHDLFQALLFGSEEIVRLLFHKHLLDVQNAWQDNFISTSYLKVNRLIHIYLQYPLVTSLRIKHYSLLIFFAVRIGRDDILHMILDYCRVYSNNFNKISTVEYNPLMEMNFQGLYGITALHYAVTLQLVEVVRRLLEKGANPNCKDFFHVTPLHLASIFQHKEICQLLLSFGANVNPNFVNLSNPLHLVSGSVRIKIFEQLKKHYFNDDSVYFIEENVNCTPTIMKLLLDNGADPNCQFEIKSDCFAPILFDACRQQRLEVVKILIENHANIRAVDSEGNSALHYTTLNSSFEIVDFLLQKGLNIDFKNNNNDTPLILAVKNGSNVEMIQYLVDCGANINAKNDNGNTALHIAIGNSTIGIECLLELGADWSILNVGKTLVSNHNVPMDRKTQVLISSIALRENELNNHIKFYVGKPKKNLTEALEYFQKSKLEITKLKTTTISTEFKTSYFDFLTKDIYTSVQMAKNSDLKMFFKSNNYKNEFPCYESLLLYRFEMAENLKDCVDESFDFILNYTNLLPEIVEMIMRNLRSIDFRVFKRALSKKAFEHFFKEMNICKN